MCAIWVFEHWLELTYCHALPVMPWKTRQLVSKALITSIAHPLILQKAVLVLHLQPPPVDGIKAGTLNGQREGTDHWLLPVALPPN